jgi:hypothetical protein
MKTYWHCEKCDTYGCVGHAKRALVTTVINYIMHDHVGSGKEGCEFDHFKVRTSLRSLRKANRSSVNGREEHGG